jgi:hypothetical protein
MKNLILSWLFFLLVLPEGFSQAIGDYRTRPGVTANWNSATAWQTYVPIFGWADINTFPTSANGAIEIQAGTTITVVDIRTVDQVTVNGTLNIAGTGALLSGPNASFINVSAGTLNVSGFITRTTTGSLLTTSSNTFFNAGSTYNHSINGNSIPAATWNSTSTCSITLTGNNPPPPINLNQSFGNLAITITSNGGSGVSNFGFTNATGVAGNLSISTTRPLVLSNAGITLNVGGNFTHLDSGTGNQNQLTLSASGPLVLNVGGNFSQANGILRFINSNGSSATISVTGNYTQSNGSLIVGGGSTTATMDFQGSLAFTAGSVDVGNNSVVNVNFLGNAVQNYSRGTTTFPNNFSRPFHFTVASTSIVDAGTSSFMGTGNFILNGTLRTGAVTGLSGTLLNSGAKTFNTNSTIVYNGVVAQTMGALYPGAPNPNLNVVINNAADVTTSSLTTPAPTNITRITGSLTLQQGSLNVGNAHTLQIEGDITAASGGISLNTPGNGSLTLLGSGNFTADPFPFAGNQSFLNLTFNRPGATVTLADNVTLNGLATLTTGTLAIGSSQLTFNGDVGITGGLLYGTNQSTLSVEGAGLADPINFAPGGNVLNTLTLNRGASVITFGGDVTITDLFNVINGTFSAGTTTITMQGTTWNVDGLFGGVFDPGTGLVIFDGSTTVTASTTFHHIQLNAARSVTFPSADINVSGDINFGVGGIFDPTDGSVVLTDALTQSVNPNGAEFYTLRVQKTGGDVDIISSLPIQHLFEILSVSTVNTFDYLLILSRGYTTDLDGAIGLVEPGAVINGNVTVQRFMDPIGNTFRYLASPVTGALRPLVWGSDIYDYNYVGGSGAWYKHPVATPLALGNGYAVKMNMVADITWSISGPVHTGTYTWNIADEGWHLLGNPYASAIQWFDDISAWELDNIATTIAVTDNSVTGYPNYFRYWSYDASDPGWGDGELVNAMVAMGQAFWIYVGAGGGSLTLHEPAKQHVDVGEFYRKKSAAPSRQLVMKLDNNVFQDRAFLKLDPHATEAFDLRYHLPKLKNEGLNIFWLAGDDHRELLKNSVAAWSEDITVPIGLEVAQAGLYSLAFDNVENFMAEPLYLNDMYEERSAQIGKEAYTFLIQDASHPVNDRFYLSSHPVFAEKGSDDTTLTIFPNPVNDVLTLEVPQGKRVGIQLLDTRGNLLHANEVAGTYQIDLRGQAQGLYVLRVFDGREVVVRKVLKVE